MEKQVIEKLSNLDNYILYEHQEVSGENFDKLKEHINDTPSLHEYFKKDWNKLKARHYCGIINYDGKDFYILPKIADQDDEKNLNIFIYMLMYAYNIKAQNEQIANSKNEKSNTIFEVFIQLFVKNLFEQFQRGVYREYITEQDNLTVLKGKYLINENLKYNFTKSKIYCEYDEFSMDNQLNQFFLYAVKILMRFAKDKKLLKQCELVLDEVTCKEFNIDSLHVNFNRLNSRFKNSFEFAILLLKKSIPLFEKDKKSFAFLFKMNELFEKFIAKMVKENYDNVTIPNRNKDFGGLSLRPDIIKDNMIIIDCKYKCMSDNKEASTEDKYQMYVYANNFKFVNGTKIVNSTMLLYPKHLDDISKNIVLGENDKKVELKMRTIDLDFSGGYIEYIEEIKKRVEEIVR